MPKLKPLSQAAIKNKRVIIRVDFNIPISDNSKIDKNEKWRIESAIPTLKYLIKKRAKIIIITHLGRPNGKKNKTLKLDLIAKEVEKILKIKVLKLDEVEGGRVNQSIAQMKEGEIVMLENIRFYPEEEKNSLSFAKKLSKLGDVFINEAFSVSHRKHASIVGITKYLPSYAGLVFEKEIGELDKVLKEPKRPLLFIIGGAKIKTKIKVIDKFIKLADKVLVGGALPNTIFAAHGIEVGKSLIERNMFKVVENLNLENSKIQLPIDFICKNTEISVKTLNGVSENEFIGDIGPKTVQLFLQEIKKAKMIIWNGPMGLVEKKPFDRASEAIARTIIQSRSYSVVGGGDTVTFINKLKLEKRFNYISTGGGAMLEYLAKETLPGIEALKK